MGPDSTAGQPASSGNSTTILQLRSPDGDATGPPLDLPVSSTTEQLTTIVNELLGNEERLPYAFFLTSSRVEVTTELQAALSESSTGTEHVVSLTYQPQSLFRVRSVTRCTASLPGHTEAVLSAVFSPDSSQIASGSGDTTVRLWRPHSQLPDKTLAGHTNWVLTVSFSPDGEKLASASMDCTVRVWNPRTGEASSKPLKGHKKWITCLAWEPYHINAACSRLVSGSKDGSLRIWNVPRAASERTLGGHTASITCVKWAGDGHIYSTSQDRTIKVWNPATGLPVRNLGAHGHWVNTMALSSDYVLKCGAFVMFDEVVEKAGDKASRKITPEEAKSRYEKVTAAAGGKERLVSGSDDFTLLLWDGIDPGSSSTVSKALSPTARMTGHQQLVNEVCFSPDGVYIASASFDKSVRVWEAATGKFLATLRGHVGAVYRVVWSADSRLLLSASKDSTCKVWDVRTRKLKSDLPGHADEVYAVDWSADGKVAVSGGKDRVLKLWHH